MKTTSKTKTASKKNNARAPKRGRLTSTIEVLALTIGTDLGNKRHAICVMGGAGEILEERTIANDREVLAAFHRFRMEQKETDRIVHRGQSAPPECEWKRVPCFTKTDAMPGHDLGLPPQTPPSWASLTADEHP